LPECDERHISGIVVDHYGFPYHYTDADGAYPLSGYPEHGPDRDEPFIGVFQALYERTLMAARMDGMRLMLSCDFGDAMVGGGFYDFLGLLRTGRYADLWNELRTQSRSTGAPLHAVLRAHLMMLVAILPDKRPQAMVTSLRKALGRTEHRRPYPTWVRSEFVQRTGLHELANHQEPYTAIKDPARRQRYYAVFWPEHLNNTVWIERLRARQGLGFADPWSDRRLAEFVLAVPQRVLNLPSETKRIAREAMRGVMPEEARRGARKVFLGPLHERAIKEYAQEAVLDLITHTQLSALGYIDEKVLRKEYEATRRGQRGLDGLWETLTLEWWLRRYWD
jgi:asparagine synthase (glutamine-hydrolysing)